MCFTPGSDPARSSSTPSNAPSPSRTACGLHISVQPAGVPPEPQEAGGGAGAPYEPGDADRLAHAPAPTQGEAPRPAPDAHPRGPPDRRPGPGGPGRRPGPPPEPAD